VGTDRVTGTDTYILPGIDIKRQRLYCDTDEGREWAEVRADLQYGWEWYQKQQEKPKDDGIDVIMNNYDRLLPRNEF
jgi:hypothetical protein